MLHGAEVGAYIVCMLFHMYSRLILLLGLCLLLRVTHGDRLAVSHLARSVNSTDSLIVPPL